MSDLVQNCENRTTASSLLSSEADRRQWAADTGQRQLESLGSTDGRIPTALEKAAKTSLGCFSGNATQYEHVLPRRETTRRVDEGRPIETSERCENQQRFDLAYEKYYRRSSSSTDEAANPPKSFFQKPIIAVDTLSQESRRAQRPEERTKEGQHRCSLQDLASAGMCPVQTSRAAALSSTRTEDMFEMPAAFARLSVDTGTTSNLTANANPNFSLPVFPQHSSSSTSETGSSAFLAMARRLHRLRLTAMSPRSDSDGKIMASKNVEMDKVSVKPTAIEGRDDCARVPQLNENIPRSSSNVAQYLPPVSSAAASLSDVSIASFYRLPMEQFRTSDIKFPQERLSPSLQKNKSWSSEPILTTGNNAAVGNDASAEFTFSLENAYRAPNDDHISSVPHGGQEAAINGTQMQSRHATTISENYSGFPATFRRSGANGLAISSDRNHDGHSSGVTSSNYPTFVKRTRSSTRMSSDAYGIHPSAATETVAAHATWSGTNENNSGAHPAPTLPPLPPGRIQSKNGPLKIETNNGLGLPSTSTVRNGSASSTPAPAIPGAASRLMDALSRHPAGELDYARLKSIIREQRKSYKRRLERERAKREALEDLLVKINSMPQLQHRSFSNSSSTASTIRNAPNRKEPNGRGGSLADLSGVIIDALPSNSSDGNSTSSEDGFLLELIQQHLRMKQALLGHLGKRNAAESSPLNSGNEHVANRYVHRDPPSTTRRGIPKLTAHLLDGLDEDEIPVGGEAASATIPAPGVGISNAAHLLSNMRQRENGGFYYGTEMKVPRSKSVDGIRDDRVHAMNNVISKEALKLALDNSSSTSENGGRFSPSEIRRQRRKWETGSSGRNSAKDVEAPATGVAVRSGSSRRQEATTASPRPSVAFFVPTNAGSTNRLVEIRAAKALQDAFRERQSNFMRRSISRQDKIRAASELRAEMARRMRELAENVAQGHIQLEEANQQLILYELPQPSAFSRSEMFYASKKKYEQLPETVARRNRLKKETDLATNRVLAKMFKHKMEYKRLIRKTKQVSASTVPSPVLITSTRSNVRLLSR